VKANSLVLETVWRRDAVFRFEHLEQADQGVAPLTPHEDPWVGWNPTLRPHEDPWVDWNPTLCKWSVPEVEYSRSPGVAHRKNQPQPDDPLQAFPTRGNLSVAPPGHWVHDSYNLHLENMAGAEPGILVPFPYSWDDICRATNREDGTKPYDLWTPVHGPDSDPLFQSY
jgi:hypothetical protein